MNLINLVISLATIIFDLNNSNVTSTVTIIKHDQAWENQSYIHAKLDQIWRVLNVTTFYL